MKFVKVLGLILLFVCFGFAFKSYQDKASSKTTVADKSDIKVIHEGSLEVTISGTGYVSPNLSVEIKCKASGEVRKLPFDVSDFVRKGDLLLELDPIDEDNNVRQAEVGLLSVESRLAQAGNNLKFAEQTLEVNRNKANANLKKMKALALNEKAKASRMKTLLSKKLVSLEDWQDAQTQAINASCGEDQARIELDGIKVEKLGLEVKRQDVMIAEADVEAKKIDLFIAQQRLKDTKIISPMDGFVSARNVQNGQIVSSGINNVGGGTSILTLIDISRIFILAYIDESNIGELKVGQDVIAKVDAFPDKSFVGKVVQICPEGKNQSNVITFETKIEIIDENKNKLKSQMTAGVEIIVAKKNKILLMPTDAIISRGDKRIVNVVGDNGKTSERTIEIGITDGIMTEVCSGVKLNERVLIPQKNVQSKWSNNSPQGRGHGSPIMF